MVFLRKHPRTALFVNPATKSLDVKQATVDCMARKQGNKALVWDCWYHNKTIIQQKGSRYKGIACLSIASSCLLPFVLGCHFPEVQHSPVLLTNWKSIITKQSNYGYERHQKSLHARGFFNSDRNLDTGHARFSILTEDGTIEQSLPPQHC